MSGLKLTTLQLYCHRLINCFQYRKCCIIFLCKYYKRTFYRDIMGFGSGSNAFNGFFWLLILLLFSWWIAALCFFPFVLVSVLTPCIDGFKNVHDLLLAGVMFPHKCSDNMVHRRSYDSF